MTVAKELDFEKTKTYFVNIQASDKAVAPEQRRSALTLLTVHVTDSDDQVDIIWMSGFEVSSINLDFLGATLIQLNRDLKSLSRDAVLF